MSALYQARKNSRHDGVGLHRSPVRIWILRIMGSTSSLHTCSHYLLGLVRLCRQQSDLLILIPVVLGVLIIACLPRGLHRNLCNQYTHTHSSLSPFHLEISQSKRDVLSCTTVLYSTRSTYIKPTRRWGIESIDESACFVRFCCIGGRHILTRPSRLWPYSMDKMGHTLTRAHRISAEFKDLRQGGRHLHTSDTWHTKSSGEPTDGACVACRCRLQG